MAMISVEEALEKILALVHTLEPEEKPILETLGQVLAEDIYSDISVPPLDNSAMDGFAVIFEDIAGASPSNPRLLEVIGEVAAGSVFNGRIRPGTAVRIMTGAPVPDGADTVVPFEETDEVKRKSEKVKNALKTIGIFKEIARGENIRRAGEDIQKGSLVLHKGTLLRPAEIGVLASVGKSKISVIRRPVVGILATGSELVEPGNSLSPGKIYNSNSYSLASLVLRYGGIPKVLGIARDSISALEEKIKQAMKTDILLTSAGVSVGDYDLVKDVLSKKGEISFWTVRMKPGKPLAFGLLQVSKNGETRSVPHLGLPGNPVSTMITFELFARAALLKMMGKEPKQKPVIEAVLRGYIENTDRRRHFARAAVKKVGKEFIARITGDQGSGILTSMAQANGLVIIPENVSEARDGEKVRVMMLDWEGEGL